MKGIHLPNFVKGSMIISNMIIPGSKSVIITLL